MSATVASINYHPGSFSHCPVKFERRPTGASTRTKMLRIFAG